MWMDSVTGEGAVSNQPVDRRGLIAAIAAFVLWGLMPIYWHLLKAVPSMQIIAHRIVWSTLLVVGWLTWRYGRTWLRETLQQPRAIWMLALSGMFIAFNWGLYIWAVNAGHVVETSLGYFINPLLNVVLGVALLGERLNRVQWVSVAIAAAGVLWLTLNYGSFPWIAIALACSFGMYGLIRKIAAVPPVRGLGVESLYLVLPALGFMIWAELRGQGGFIGSSEAGGWGMLADGLLILGGALTAIPLIAYADAVRRIPFTMVGLIQYIAPTLQLLCGVLVFSEPFGSERMIGFALIWLALALFAIEGFTRSRRRAAAVET